jgi:hypothetical protein
MAGVPYAIALGVLSFGTAMLQIGTWLVWIPVATWLFHQGEVGWALFTAVLGIVINVLDNVIKPLLIGHGAGVPIWIILVRLCWKFYLAKNLLNILKTLVTSNPHSLPLNMHWQTWSDIGALNPPM